MTLPLSKIALLLNITTKPPMPIFEGAPGSSALTPMADDSPQTLTFNHYGGTMYNNLFNTQSNVSEAVPDQVLPKQYSSAFSASTSISIELQKLTRHFIYHDEATFKRLLQLPENAGTKIFVVHGSSGTGKTSLCRKFVKEYLDQ